MAADPGAAAATRIVSGAGAQPWAVPSVGGAAQARPDGMLTAGHLESIEREARESGYAAGHAAGLEAGRAEIARRAAALDKIFAGLCRPLEQLDAEVEQELVELVLAATRRLVRRELKTSPGEIVAVVREGIASLPVGERQVRVHLHPEDARLVEQVFGANEASPACRIIADPALTRGGARITTEVSAIDASLETRLARVCERVLGSDRQRPEDEA